MNNAAMTMRYDRAGIAATVTAEGYIEDSPVLTRTGVFTYHNPDGTTRREYRPPNAVFAQDSLALFRGLPITDGHPGAVDSGNARRLVVGAVLSPGRQDGNNLVADVRIYDPSAVNAGRKELSVGSMVVLDETPGVTDEGERYDAIQTNIRPNHLALVAAGRAGNARLNLDAADEAASTERREGNMPDNMQTVRLDGGLTYQAAPEVARELDKLREDLAAAVAAKDAAEARADAAKAEADKLKADAEKIRADAVTEAIARVKLEDVAKRAGVEVKADASDRDIHEGVIKKLGRHDGIDLSEKSDAYISAAYDLAVADSARRTDALSDTRQRMAHDSGDGQSRPLSASNARQKMILAMRGKADA